MLLDHVCTMHIHMLLDNDAYVHDAYICDIQSLTMLHVCMMRLKFCDQPTNEEGDSRSRKCLAAYTNIDEIEQNGPFAKYGGI